MKNNPQYSDFNKKKMFEELSHLFNVKSRLENFINALEEFTNSYKPSNHWRTIHCWEGNRKVSETLINNDETYICFLN